MFCKSMKDNRIWATLVVVGIISFVFGIIGNIGVPDEADNISTLMGMFTGVGCAFIAIGIFKLIHYKKTSAEKLKQEEIELKDERNIQLLRIACSVSNAAGYVLFAIMAFVFIALDYRIPAFICIGALYVQLLAFLISYRFYSSRM